MLNISTSTTLHELLAEHPELLEFLANYHPEFEKLRNPILRATMARVATIEQMATFAGIPAEKVLADIRARLESSAAQQRQSSDARLAKLKQIIRQLHAGTSPDALRQEFAELLRNTDPTEISRLEQELLHEGMPVEEIHRLCDLHVNMFRPGLESQEKVQAPPGHPIHTYQAENVEISRRVQRWTDLCRRVSRDEWSELSRDLASALNALAQIEIHYQRKENQLFPYLERKGFNAPTQVMWAVHDDIRRMLKEARAAIAQQDVYWLNTNGIELARVITEMIYKEEKILFPNAWKLLSDADWSEIRAGDDQIGYLIPPEIPAPPPTPTPTSALDSHRLPEQVIPLNTGGLTLKQLDRMLVTMPVEFSFVDDQDIVRFYSGHDERIFPRSPAVIGRAVQNCHPPKSLHMVNAILDAFRKGERDMAEFWINFKGRFLYITYHAVRDEKGKYLGTLEVTLDATRIRSLQGERRLLEWQ